MIVIVTGSHLSAEVYDRPLAYRVREAIVRRLRDDEGVEDGHLRVVVCSDVWYLNQDQLRGLPTISIGGPGVSALSAYLADRLPSVLAVDGLMIVQMDTSEGVAVASVWGVDASATSAAVEAFEDRWLDVFLGSVEAE